MSGRNQSASAIIIAAHGAVSLAVFQILPALSYHDNAYQSRIFFHLSQSLAAKVGSFLIASATSFNQSAELATVFNSFASSAALRASAAFFALRHCKAIFAPLSAEIFHNQGVRISDHISTHLRIFFQSSDLSNSEFTQSFSSKCLASAFSDLSSNPSSFK